MIDDDTARKPDRDGIPGVDREGEFKDKDVAPTGDAAPAPRREGGFEDKDVRPGELGEREQREGAFTDKDVPDRVPGQEVSPEGEYEDKDQRLEGHDRGDHDLDQDSERGSSSARER